jgi:hypothetical protein
MHGMDNFKIIEYVFSRTHCTLYYLGLLPLLIHSSLLIPDYRRVDMKLLNNISYFVLEIKFVSKKQNLAFVKNAEKDKVTISKSKTSMR